MCYFGVFMLKHASLLDFFLRANFLNFEFLDFIFMDEFAVDVVGCT